MANLKEALATANDGETRHIVSLSGGKDSTALAIFMRQQYPELPIEYVFCDTGAELLKHWSISSASKRCLGKKSRASPP
jgi:3'-phosphoadenosine 5'-phosphosulfate sulfotransferase (PAPS reductase)/FAD synthetase